ncbi:hypothetical protein QL285_066026 [Trifolium repens]|nr:hypothetical protein QL285_066026 [Trifolium repens]
MSALPHWNNASKQSNAPAQMEPARMQAIDKGMTSLRLQLQAQNLFLQEAGEEGPTDGGHLGKSGRSGQWLELVSTVTVSAADTPRETGDGHLEAHHDLQAIPARPGKATRLGVGGLLIPRRIDLGGAGC